MASFLKEFLLEDGKRLNPDTGRALLLAAFGKHPAWKDHVEAIGLTTPSLVMAKERLYDEGIGGKGGPITSGAWDKLAPGEELPGFGHLFVWWRSGQFLLGRLWASSDSARPPRTRYPFIVCLHVAGVPLAWALRNLLPALDEVPVFGRIQSAEEIDATVKQVWNSEVYRSELRAQVQAGIDRLQQQLRASAAEAPADPTGSKLTPDERQQFVSATELGPAYEGLLRILHQVGSRFSAYLGQKSLAKSDAAMLQPAQIRVPVAAPSAAEGMLRWIEFFNLFLAPDTPLLLAAPMDANWIDLTVGEPTGDELFCLRASARAVPLTSSIPFTLDAAVRDKGVRLIGEFLSGQVARTERKSAQEGEGFATTFFRRLTLKGPAKPSTKTKFWIMLAGALLAVACGWFALPKNFWNANDARIAAKIEELIPKAQAQMRLTEQQRKEQLAVLLADAKFNETLAAARTAEQTKDLRTALARYDEALKLKPDEPECVHKTQWLRQAITLGWGRTSNIATHESPR